MSLGLTHNVESKHQTKDIDIQYHYTRKFVNKEDLTIK